MALAKTISKLNVATTLKDVFGARDVTTPAMQAAIEDWFSMYYTAERQSAENENSAMQIPYTIVDGVSEAVFGEYKTSLDNEKDTDGRYDAVLQGVDRIRSRAFQRTLIGGEGFIKPVIANGTVRFVFVDRRSYAVLERSLTGDITSIATSERTIEGKYYYTLLERRTAKSDGVLIQNRLYRSRDENVIGEQISLNTLKQYETLVPELSLDVTGLGLVPIKMPTTNCIDGSHDGVSIYAAAADKIKLAYKHEHRTEMEYELTEPHLVASIDVQRRDPHGRLIEIPPYIDAIDEDPQDVGVHVYNPTPHQEELEKRENQHLRAIENICGLRRGFLGHVDNEEKTATEIIATSTKFANTVESLQTIWEQAVKESVELAHELGALYLDWENRELPDIYIEWGDGVLYDRQQDWVMNYELTNAGYQRPEFILGWKHGLPTDTEEQLKTIRERFMPQRSQEFGGYLFGEDE